MDIKRIKELSATGYPVALAPEQMLELLQRLEDAERHLETLTKWVNHVGPVERTHAINHLNLYRSR